MKSVVSFSLVVAVLCGAGSYAMAGSGCGGRKVYRYEVCHHHIEVELALPYVRRFYVASPVVEVVPEIVEAPRKPAPPIQRQSQRQAQRQSTVQQQTGPTINFNPNINVQVQPQQQSLGATALPDAPIGPTVNSQASTTTTITPQMALALPPAGGELALSPANSQPSFDLSSVKLSNVQLEWQFDTQKARYFSHFHMQIDAATGQRRQQTLLFYPSLDRRDYIYLYDVATQSFWARRATTYHKAYVPHAPQWQIYIDGQWHGIERGSKSTRDSSMPDPQFNVGG